MYKITMNEKEEMIIDKKATIQFVKQNLKFLKEYFHLIAMEDKELLMSVEEHTPLLDYVHYSKSIVQMFPSTSYKGMDLADAVTRQQEDIDKKFQLQKQRKAKCHLLMNAISQLTPLEQKVLVLKYLQKKSNQEICHELDYISMSTMHRILQRACLQIAKILDIEVIAS